MRRRNPDADPYEQFIQKRKVRVKPAAVAAPAPVIEVPVVEAPVFSAPVVEDPYAALLQPKRARVPKAQPVTPMMVAPPAIVRVEEAPLVVEAPVVDDPYATFITPKRPRKGQVEAAPMVTGARPVAEILPAEAQPAQQLPTKRMSAEERLRRQREWQEEQEAIKQRQMVWLEQARAMLPKIEDHVGRAPAPVAAGELDPIELIAIRLVRELEESDEQQNVRAQLELPPLSPSEEAELQEKIEIAHMVLSRFGYIDPKKPGDTRFIRRLQKRVYSVLLRNATVAAHKMLRGRPEFDKQEIAAEIAAYCYMNLHRFEGRSKLMTWVWASARNFIISLLQRNKARGVTGMGSGGMTEAGTYIKPEVLDALVAKGLISEVTAQYARQRGLRAQADAEELDTLAAPEVEDEELALETAYGLEEDRIVSEAFAKLKAQDQEILKAAAHRGKVILPSGSEVDVGTEQPSALIIGYMVGLPERVVGKALWKARKALNENMERPVVPPYNGSLAALLLVSVRKAQVNAKGKVNNITNADDAATIAAQQASGRASLPSVLRKRLQKEPVEIGLLRQHGPKARETFASSWVDRDASYPVALGIEGEGGRMAHLQTEVGGEPEVMGVFQRDRPTVGHGRYSYYSMGESRNNPDEGGEFYYSDARDLFNMLQDGEITQEQYEVCLADIEAGLEDA